MPHCGLSLKPTIFGESMKHVALLTSLLFYTPFLLARPSLAELIPIGHSVVMVSSEIDPSKNGRGSGVVVSEEYVATNCHILANTKGASMAKFRNGYKPLGIKANWRRDLCLLKFHPLPLKPVSMRDSSTLKYEEEVVSIGFPAGFNVPQPSYGNVKALYPYESSNIIRTSTSFTLGSSGGALFDSDFNLIGITTFKSPGKRGNFYYSLPVEWIKELMESPILHSLKTDEVPFWALPLEKRPYFMQVVIPYQNQAWDALEGIATAWTKKEPTSADAWYYLGAAEAGKGDNADAKKHLKKAYELNARDLEAMVALSQIAVLEKDIGTLEQLQMPIKTLSATEGEKITKQIAELKK